MVLIQNLFGLFQIQHILRRVVPRHIDEPIQIGARNRRLRRERCHFGQTFNFFFCRFFGLRRQTVLFNFYAQGIQFLLEIIFLAEFLLNRLHLLVQIIFFLVLFNLGADLGVDFFL